MGFRQLLVLGVLLATSRCQHTPPAPARPDSTFPDKFILLVFDQMRPDYVARFQLRNFKSLAEKGLKFSNATVGHLFSLTVISHPVITSGLFPKNLPIPDDIFMDEREILGGGKDFYDATRLSEFELRRIFSGLDEEPHLLSILKKTKGGKVFSVAQKNYAAFGMAASFADSIITCGTTRTIKPLLGWKAPSGVNVPDYIKNPFGGRFYLDARSQFGSAGTLYPLDGTRYVPGPDKSHEGGDRWVGDIVQSIIENEPDFTAITASFGSIDRIGHMLGEQEKRTTKPWALSQKLDLRSTLQRADTELGRILRTLEDRKLLERTVLVVTADHGAQANVNFHGLLGPKRHSKNWIYGHGANFAHDAPSPSLKSVIDSFPIRVSVHDTALRFWLKAPDRAVVSQLTAKVRDLPGVAEIYAKIALEQSVQYVRMYRNKLMSSAQLSWANNNHEALLESMIGPHTPDVVALLLDGHGYGTLGDHGGAQERVQRIPLYILAPAFRGNPKIIEARVRLVDINPIVRRLMGLRPSEKLDGSSASLSTIK